MKQTLNEQLSAVKENVKLVGLPDNPSRWGNDGEDHINVAAMGETRLGRMLSMRNSASFSHPLLGDFRSLNNAWYFISAKNHSDKLRHITDHTELREYVRRNGGETHSVPNMYATVMHVAYLRILSMPLVMRDMIESELPFDSYRILGVLRQRFPVASNVCLYYEEIRKALKERREPNFGPLLKPSAQRKKGKQKLHYYAALLSDITGKTVAEDPDISKWIAEQWAAYDQQEAKRVKIKLASIDGAQTEKRAKRKDLPRKPDAGAVPVEQKPVYLAAPGVTELGVRDTGDQVCAVATKAAETAHHPAPAGVEVAGDSQSGVQIKLTEAATDPIKAIDAVKTLVAKHNEEATSSIEKTEALADWEDATLPVVGQEDFDQ